ncbi:sugar ABC transporter substrate-binding protein [Cyanobacteria bacterium FACHB-63]|nr:sugar ABC transporter substrate-binding protein [Cyanobacteria bacterium FACHB-63]
MIQILRRLSVLTPLLLCFSGCRMNATQEGTIQVWVHTGQTAERQTIEQQVDRFNASQSDVKVKLTFIPEGSYNAQLQAASVSKNLPDVVELDGPTVYNYIWQGNLIPIDTLLPSQVQQDLLPSIINQGTYKGRLYSVGTFDSGLGLYGRRSRLEAAGVRIPKNNQDAWTSEEFNQVLAVLAQKDPDRQVLDLKLNSRGEWYSYAFLPLIDSAGGRTDPASIDRFLNSRSAVFAMQQIQSWIQKGYVDPNLDDASFASGRVALAWGGHWDYQTYAKAVGNDLVVLPLPNFGNGSKTAQGSWNWGITTNSKHPKSAARFLEFLLQPKEVLAMATVNSAVPGTKSAIAQSKLYAKGGTLSLFSSQLLSGQTVPRSQTPAYPVITSTFEQAFADVRNGLDVKTTLNKAATAIAIDLQDNQGYPDVHSVSYLSGSTRLQFKSYDSENRKSQ